MTVNETTHGTYRVLVSDAGTVLAAIKELMQHVSDLGMAKEKIVKVDITNKIVVLKT